jgi:hypothetical protein
MRFDFLKLIVIGAMVGLEYLLFLFGVVNRYDKIQVPLTSASNLAVTFIYPHAVEFPAVMKATPKAGMIVMEKILKIPLHHPPRTSSLHSLTKKPPFPSGLLKNENC